MLLTEILHPNVIKTGLEAEDKFEAIEDLIDVLIQAHELPLSKRDEIRDEVFERERSHGTGMECYIALPHATTDKVDDVIAALGVSRRGIPFDCHDGLPARIIILLLLPKRNFQGHVRTLAGVAHLLRNAAFRDALIASPTAAAALKLITEEEERYLLAEQQS
ncbi:MAG: PTS sugar transporter subunit IIA [Candidatus Hydrogenedentes bacterium]|nr:PTS sugar transporter subunit IIA [Candidatus Hydrogenedentota bacterium]